MGRVTAMTFKLPSGVVESTDVFSYNLVGNRTTSENANVKVTSTYDIMDREVTRTILFKATGLSRVLSFGYDLVGRRKRMADDTGREVLYGYDLNSRLTRLEVKEVVRECTGSTSPPGGAHAHQRPR